MEHTIKIAKGIDVGSVNTYCQCHTNMYKNFTYFGINGKSFVLDFEDVDGFQNIMLFCEKHYDGKSPSSSVLNFVNNETNAINRVALDEFPPAMFKLNKKVYFIVNDGIYSYYPKIKQHVSFEMKGFTIEKFTTGRHYCDQVTDKYIVCNVHYIDTDNKKTRVTYIYELDFKYVTMLHNQMLQCVCNNNVLVFTNYNKSINGGNHFVDYYDTKTNKIIEGGQFFKWHNGTALEYDHINKSLTMRKFDGCIEHKVSQNKEVSQLTTLSKEREDFEKEKKLFFETYKTTIDITKERKQLAEQREKLQKIALKLKLDKLQLIREKEAICSVTMDGFEL